MVGFPKSHGITWHKASQKRLREKNNVVSKGWFHHQITATMNFKLLRNFKQLLALYFKLLHRGLGNLRFWRLHEPLALVASSTLAAICPWRLSWETHSGSSGILGNESESEMPRKTTSAITIHCRGVAGINRIDSRYHWMLVSVAQVQQQWHCPSGGQASCSTESVFSTN